MRIAFYAPMKPPNSEIPSGDRHMARLLMAALGAAGHEVELASVFRSRDGDGNGARQERLRALGGRMAQRLQRRYAARPANRRPELWFTYHLYHKAPDWLGPEISAAMDIPYMVAEASFAPKRAGGAWALGHEAAQRAIRKADVVIGLNSGDAPCVLPLLKSAGRLVPLRPFTDIAPYAEAAARRADHRAEIVREFDLDENTPLLLAVAMMRDGDKLASYRLLGEALEMVLDRPWRLVVAGDGPMRSRVAEALAPLGPDRVRFAGLQAPDRLPRFYAAADIMVWPAIREAYGMALVEAQAAGLAVVAGDSGGVADIVDHGNTGVLAPAGDVEAFAGALNSLLADPEKCRAMGAQARRTAALRHSIPAAAAGLDGAIASATGRTAG